MLRLLELFFLVVFLLLLLLHYSDGLLEMLLFDSLW